MNFSPLSNIPVTLGQRTPDVLKKPNRVRGQDFYGDRSYRQDTSIVSQRQNTSSFPSRSFIQEPSYNNNILRETSYQDASLDQKSFYRRQDGPLPSTYNRGYRPMEQPQPRNMNLPASYENYVSRPKELLNIILTFNIVNGLIVCVASAVFLYLNLSLISFVAQKSWLSPDSWQFLRTLLFLGGILISRVLMLQHYDIFINWSDIFRDLFSRGPILQLLLLISFVSMIGFTHDVFSFFVQPTTSEVAQILVAAFLNSFFSNIAFLFKKKYLLNSCSFETTWSYFSIYRLKRLIAVAVEYVVQSLQVIIFSSILCYVGFVSLLLEDSADIFNYQHLHYPGHWVALENVSKCFVGIWCANFILQVQLELMKKISIRLLRKIGNTQYTMRPLYYFNTISDGDEVLVSHCLRFLDSKLRYECRNSLLCRQNFSDPESKTIWHVFVETTLEKLDKINTQLQALKVSRLILTGSFAHNPQNENILLALEYFFTSPPPVRDLRDLFHEICIMTHQFKVINRAFLQMKILNLDLILRNFNINLQAYYQGLYNTYSLLQNIKSVNKSSYVDALLENIQPFEEVVQEGLLMLNKFVSLR